MDPSVMGDAELLDMLSQLAFKNTLLTYQPYPWQKRFHDASSFAPERMLMCANGVGKSFTVANEVAMHATGRYPPWWEGCRYEKGGFEIWVGSIDNDMQKIGLQRALFGRDLSESFGTGAVPGDAITNLELRHANVKDVIDIASIRHQGGNLVNIKFKTYEQGWRKWQSGDPRIIAMDEEPDENQVDQKYVFSEIQTRLVRNQGILLVGYTPLLGETELTRHFMYPKAGGIWWIGATWDDAPHMSEDDKARLRATYSEHQREARTLGVPMMGEGRVFTTPERSFVIDPIALPDHWARITGVDFGFGHPAAVVSAAIDRDLDIIYLVSDWREEGKKLSEHAQASKAPGKWIPVAWPHDGEKHDPGSGKRFHVMYRDDHEVNMISRSARYKTNEGGPQAEWPIIEDVKERLDTGRLKVFSTCKNWLEEYRSYHLKDGKLVARREDTLKASFYALMMRRYAISQREGMRYLYRDMQPAAFTTGVVH